MEARIEVGSTGCHTGGTVDAGAGVCAIPLLVLLAVSACSPTASPVPGWCAGVGGDPSIVFNGGESQPLELREVWRRGGLQAGEELARPDPPAIDGSGRVVLSDWGLGEVVAIGENGRW